MTDLLNLEGKVALINGSSRGIGRSIAETYARQGAKVVISSRKPEPCAAVAEEIREQGGQAISVPCHIGDKAQLENVVERTLEAWGRIDILVCNAATNPLYGPLSDLTDEAYDKIMDTNVKSTFWLCNMVLPKMADQGGGSVIMLSSIAALRGSTGIGCYGMSKAAEAALTRNLAVEWGPRQIRVNAIAPGVVETDFAKALVEDPVRRQRAETRTPLRRLGQPEEIAGVAVFLASSMSSYVTGQVVVADGGETIS